MAVRVTQKRQWGGKSSRNRIERRKKAKRGAKQKEDGKKKKKKREREREREKVESRKIRGTGDKNGEVKTY